MFLTTSLCCLKHKDFFFFFCILVFFLFCNYNLLFILQDWKECISFCGRGPLIPLPLGLSLFCPWPFVLIYLSLIQKKGFLIPLTAVFLYLYLCVALAVWHKFFWGISSLYSSLLSKVSWPNCRESWKVVAWRIMVNLSNVTSFLNSSFFFPVQVVNDIVIVTRYQV